ncbi:YbjN domain-containing protein [Psychrobacter aestuarii]|uniref:YbjN domain-containing protein n=1 Tax=Psychrobacter aestuarii TaxID=556327 RepID=A0ABN0VTL9_9GAMM|nr:YbjN domain-containing protein [Psychrobacter aestuarii]
MSQNNKSLWQKIKQLFGSNPAATEANAEHTAQPISAATDNAADDIAEAATDTQAKAKPQGAKSATDNTNATPITDTLKRYFEQQDWQYNEYAAKSDDALHTTHLSLRMRHKDIECGYLFRIQENNGLLAVYGILPFTIPDSHKNAALLLMTQINYDMIVGNLEMDLSDGEIRFKNAFDIEVVGISHDIIDHLLQSVVAMTTVAYEVFGDLLKTQSPASDMDSLLQELQQEADARTFFLPTDSVQ